MVADFPVTLLLFRSRYVQDIRISGFLFAAELTIQDMLNVLENLVADESSVTVRLACLGLRVVNPLMNKHGRFAIRTILLYT